MLKGEIVLIPFPFTDLSGSKLRPALILAQTASDITVSFITTQLQWKEATDIVLQPALSTGIKKTSIVRLSKLATIDKSLSVGKIGALSLAQLNELNTKLKIIFKLN